MSAPLSGSADGSPIPGFYPDPSIPGYIRYWNGTSWVPGTSRPEPSEGESMPAPPPPAVASSATGPPTRAEPAPAEETGPIFLDELGAQDAQVEPGEQGMGADPLPEVRPRGEMAAREPLDWDDPGRLHGMRPETASAWGTDASQQGGTGRESSEHRPYGWPAAPAGDTGGPGAASPTGSAHQPAYGEGTFQMRALSPEGPHQPEGPNQGTEVPSSGASTPGGGDARPPEHTVGLRRSDVLKSLGQEGQEGQAGQAGREGQESQGGRHRQPQDAQAAQAASPSPSPSPSPAPPEGAGAGSAQRAAPSQDPGVPAQSAPSAQPPPTPAVPAQAAPHQTPPQTPPQAGRQAPPQPPPGPGTGPAPAAQGAGGSQPPGYPPPGGQPSWAQQVHDLAAQPAGSAGPAGPGGPAAPWRPPASDPFQRAAEEHQVRPSGLGKRFAARLVDGLLTGAVVGAVAFPLVSRAIEHIQDKMDAVRQAGRTEQVWLIDGTTGGCLALVLGAFLVFGLLYEVLPTQRWGRTLGKRLFGLRVLTMERQEVPGFGAALRRWLVYGVLSLLVVGVVNLLWCLFDHPWRQCWHDKLAGTFVSKDAGEIRL